MPLFMMISGYFSSNLSKKPVRETIATKAKTLLLPVLIWCVVIWLFSYLLFDTPYTNLFKDIALGGLWYLKSLFICIVFYILSCNSFRNKILGYTIFILISQFISTYQIRLMFPIFLIGVFINVKDTLIRKNTKEICIISLFLFLIFIYFNDKDYIWLPTYIKYGVLQGKYILEFIAFSLFKLIIGITGSIFFITLFMWIIPLVGKNKMITNILTYGKYTLGVYILQTLILETILPKYLQVSGLSSEVTNFIVTPVISLIVLFITILIYKKLQSIKIGRFLFGQK